eukprot:3789898-Heterocapsa_arctica.AAC.1
MTFRFTGNHPSFSSLLAGDGPEPPTHDLVRGYLRQGFADTFHSVEEAQRSLGGELHLAPLGNIRKARKGGTGFKHRIIQDLKINE